MSSDARPEPHLLAAGNNALSLCVSVSLFRSLSAQQSYAPDLMQRWAAEPRV
jgi:hypothetical protein